MKTHINAFVLLIVAVNFVCFNSACTNKKSPIENLDIASEEEAVKATLTQMWAAIENEDIEQYASYIHPDFTQFGESDSTLKLGKEMEVMGTRAWLSNSSDIHTDMIDPIVVIKGELAWILYYWQDHGISNGEAFSSRGKSTRIFVKEAGKWLCIHGHYTLLP